MSKTTTPTVTTFITAADKPTLEQAQKLVGGYVEMVTSRVDPTIQVLVNEDGLIQKLQHNERASNIAGLPICGNVVLLKCEARW